MVCINYNKPRHNTESCFQLIGYPDCWGEKPKGNGRGRGLGGVKKPTISSGRGRGGLIRANATSVTS